jgi:hypothetical protein
MLEFMPEFMNDRDDNPLIGMSVTISPLPLNKDSWYMDRGFQNYSYLVVKVVNLNGHHPAQEPRWGARLTIQKKIKNDKSVIRYDMSNLNEFCIDFADLMLLQEGNRHYIHLLERLED